MSACACGRVLPICLPPTMTRPDLIYDDVNALYGLRSGIIHGSVRTPRALSKSIRRVSGASRTSLLGEQIELALDRGETCSGGRSSRAPHSPRSHYSGPSRVPPTPIASCGRNPDEPPGSPTSIATGPTLAWLRRWPCSAATARVLARYRSFVGRRPLASRDSKGLRPTRVSRPTSLGAGHRSGAIHDQRTTGDLPT